VLFGGVPATETSPSAVHRDERDHTTASGRCGGRAARCAADSFNFANGFTYVSSSPIVSAVVPSFGSTAGGTLVRITGANFRRRLLPFFDNLPARAAEFISTTEMIGDVPPHAAGKVAVALRCSGAPTARSRRLSYSTAAEPSGQINSVTPLAGAPGQPVTLSGIRFRRDDTVTFDTASAVLLSAAPDADVVRVPDILPAKPPSR